MMVSYYGDLSDASSSSCSSSSEEDVEECLSNEQQKIYQDVWSRQCIHLDIDCFYCQCEELDRGLRKNPRPLAIGQKHIIVTSNYEARKFGVKKLQLREDAMMACPHLLIVEGSDLQQYRKYSRSVYEAFRRALNGIATQLGISIPARKGSMDEMMADLSPAVNQILEQGASLDITEHEKQIQTMFIYGESKSPTKLVEDQTGQETIVSFHERTNSPGNDLPPSRRNVHESYGTEQDRKACIERLKIASKLVARVSQYIFKETGFYTTCGVSASPLLAKLASDLNKPKSINILFPFYSHHLLYGMPLRKMQNVGRGTMRALEASLESFSSTLPTSPDGKKPVKTVLDLLRIPHESIVKSLETLQAFQGSSTEQCDLLLQRCRGLDTSKIIDDEGGLPKTVSVENSFRRGTVCSLDKVEHALNDLLYRLPLLLNDRTSWAVTPERAFPTTIRLTIRMVDRNLVGNRRRPFVTKSKQTTMTVGKSLTQEKDTHTQSLLLRQFVAPLLNQLVQASAMNSDINVTRMNIALTNFQDVPSKLWSTPIPGQSLLSASVQKHSIGNSGSPSPAKKRRSISGGLSQSSFIAANRPSSFHTNQSQSVKVPFKASNKMKVTRIDNFFQRKPPTKTS